jgi:hypothetical protein
MNIVTDRPNYRVATAWGNVILVIHEPGGRMRLDHLDMYHNTGG